jgi:hypothetical protein
MVYRTTCWHESETEGIRIKSVRVYEHSENLFGFCEGRIICYGCKDAEEGGLVSGILYADATG